MNEAIIKIEKEAADLENKDPMRGRGRGPRWFEG